MRHKYLSVIGFVILAGCSVNKAPPPAPPSAQPEQNTTRILSGTGTLTPASTLDVASATERAAAKSSAQNGRQLLGVTVAALGNPAQTGFWIKTSLVDEQTKGQIASAANGAKVTLTLIPLEAAGGSQLSLSAMRMLQVPLTSLVEVKVYKLAP